MYKRQDDDRELCALIKRSVQSEHIEADFCNTGKEGLQKLKEQEYQLVGTVTGFCRLALLSNPRTLCMLPEETSATPSISSAASLAILATTSLEI